MMKQKKIETHKIGLVGQAPSRRGDPRKPLAGPNGQKIARLAGMSYDELIACRRRHLNTHYNAKGGKDNAFDHAKGSVKRRRRPNGLARGTHRPAREERRALFRLPRPAFSGGDTHLWTPVLDLSASFWRQSMVERATKRTTRSTASAAIPPGRHGFGWISKQRAVHSVAVTGEFERHEQLPCYSE